MHIRMSFSMHRVFVCGTCIVYCVCPCVCVCVYVTMYTPHVHVQLCSKYHCAESLRIPIVTMCAYDVWMCVIYVHVLTDVIMARVSRW